MKKGAKLRKRLSSYASKKAFSIADLPEGFSYWPGFITSDEELELLELFGTLHFKAFNFQGYIAKRRIIAYGFEVIEPRLKIALFAGEFVIVGIVIGELKFTAVSPITS
ncbi:MAG TPA: hypothetical protein VGK24_09695 [Candidatus Angelobacter sp.]